MPKNIVFNWIFYIHVFIFITFSVFNDAVQAQSQTLDKDSISESSMMTLNTRKNNFSGGIQAGALSIEGFARVQTGMYFKIGAAFEYGINITNLVLLGEEHFAKKNSINLSDEGGESDYLLVRRGLSFFINFETSKNSDLTLGYKSSRIYSDAADSSWRDGEGIEGRFKSFFIQPAFGRGWFQYSCSFMIGRFSTNGLIFNEPVIPEFGIMFQPLIIRLVIR